jgi:TfoX N-terminal domain
MPFDAGLAERLGELVRTRPGMQEKKMFGGIGWLLNGNMCVGVYKDFLIIRVGEETGQRLLGEPHVKAMDITGKPMKGWAMVAPEGYAGDADLKRFVKASLGFVASLPEKE